MQIDTYKWYCNGDCWKSLIGTSYDKDDDFSGADSSEFKSDYLLQLKNQLSANTDKKEIPIKDTYSTIEAALTDPDKFYELYTKVTKNLSFYTTCSDMDGFKESITSKPNNDTDVFLHDITASLFKNMYFSKNIGSYSASEGFVCAVNPEITAPNQCHFYTSSDKDSYHNNYLTYFDYWTKVLSLPDKNWSFSYKNTANGCMLPHRLYDESERLYDVDNKPKYLVQNALKLGNAKSFDAESDYCYGIERLSYELPLHTIAKFVKDVTIQTPKDKVPVANQQGLTDPELQAIRAKYKSAFIEALKNDFKNENKIKTLVDRGTFVQKGSNIVISVPGIKTQVVPVKDITTTLDAAKNEATNKIKALTHLKRLAKKPYLLRVKNATTIKDIDQAIKDAQTADLASADAATARAELEAKIRDATGLQNKDAYKYASPDKKDAFDKALNDARAFDIDSKKSAADLASVNSALDTAMDNLDGEEKVIDIKRAEALAKLTDYGIPNDGQDNPYRIAINNADDTDGINNVLITLSKQLLGKVIRSANELKTNADVKYTQASKATKEPFETQLSEATTLYDKNDVPLPTLEKLDGARDGLSKAMNDLDGVAQAQLANKKGEAKGQLENLGLSNKDKQEYEEKIKNAQSEDAVDKLLKEAQLTGAKTKAVQAVTDAATQKKQDLMTNQGTSTKDEVDAAQKEVSQFEDAAKEAISKAENEDAVNSKKDEAIGKINGVVAKNAAKDKAKTTIQNLKHLDQNDKDSYCGQVDSASNQDEIDKAVKDAQAADLAKVKDAAKKTIGDLKYLEQNEKTTYTGQVDKAANEDAVNTIVKNAQAADLAKATAAKDKAKEQLKDYPLSKEDKEKLEGEITNAQDEKAINAALLKAAKAALDKVINEAKAKKSEVVYTKATPEKKDVFDKKLEAANTAKAAQDATVKSLNTARTDLTDAMGKLDGKADAQTDLPGKKKKANDELGGLGLTDDEKKPFENEINGAQNEGEVEAALLNAAKAALDKVINEAKAKQKEDVYTKATPEKKNAFDGKLAAANTAKDAQDATVKSLNTARTELTDAMGKLDGKAEKTEEPTQQEHIYVYDANDIDESEAANATTMLYRLYNKWTHEHLFTTDKDEYDTLVAAGWTGEESAGMVAVNQGKGVYRLYNPNTGEHHYTTDENELAACVKAGWVNEGIKFHSVQNGTVPVYSMYNPYEKRFYHHYTSDPVEIAKMVKAGWVKEEIKWYAAPKK